MKKLLMVALAAFAGVASMACNTVQGVGRDIQAGGEAIERVAK